MQLVAPDPTWTEKFTAQRDQLVALMPEVRVEHIGSTSIPGIVAKPIVDLLIGAPDEPGQHAARVVLRTAGWTEEGNRPGHAWLCLPDPANRAYIAHVVVAGDDVWHKRLTFRDELRAHPEIATEYQALKQNLAARHHGDLTAYTRAKAEFVTDVLNRQRGSHSPLRATLRP